MNTFRMQAVCHNYSFSYWWE